MTVTPSKSSDLILLGLGGGAFINRTLLNEILTKQFLNGVTSKMKVLLP
jgi:hypothetical protein